MLKFSVDGQKLTRENRQTIAADSIGYLTAQFTFCSDWEGLSKIVAVFEKGTEKQARILTNGYILESDNLSLSKGTWLVSVVGYLYEGETVTKQITTTTVEVPVEKTLTDEDGNPLPSISPGYEAQILAIAENALSVYTVYDPLVSYVKGRRAVWNDSSFAWINEEASVAGTTPENEYPVTGWLCIARKGTDGGSIFSGSAITGTSTTPTVYATGIENAKVNDRYRNTNSGGGSYLNEYKCVTPGDAATAEWIYDGSALADHAHGNIDKDGKIGATADLPVFTGVDGSVEAVTAESARTKLGLGDAATKTVGSGAGNVPVLNASGKLDDGLISAVIIGENKGDVSSQTDLTSLSTANSNDMATVTSDADAGKNGKYILFGDYSVLGNWHQLTKPGLTPGDIGAATAAQGAKAESAVQPAVIAAITSGGVISGGVVSAQGTPDQTVAVSEIAVLKADGTIDTVAAVSSLTAAAADATNPRKDIVYLSAAYVVTYLAGTAHATQPTAPAVPAGGHILATIYRAANDNTIASGDITDHRQSIRSNGAMMLELLWENSSPSSSFASQTIPLELSEDDYCVVLYSVYASAHPTGGTAIFKVGDGFIPFACTTKNRYRLCSSSGSGLYFPDCIQIETYGTTSGSTTDNLACVPTYIFRMKGVGDLT